MGSISRGSRSMRDGTTHERKRLEFRKETVVRLPIFALGASALVACGNTYHPEYHPVTVTSYEQHVSYPAAAAASASAQPASVFFRPPPPQQPPTPAPWSAWPDQ
jgi:hypothetical protein